MKILMRHHQFSGLFPKMYVELAENETLGSLLYVHNEMPHECRKPFTKVSQTEVTTQDREYCCKIMKLDPRDRPMAKELLQEEWFQVD